MEEHIVVSLPKPGSGVTDDPLLAVLREGARRMLMQAIEAEVEMFLAAHAGLVEEGAGGGSCAMVMRPSGGSRPALARSRSAGPRCVTVLRKVSKPHPFSPPGPPAPLPHTPTHT